MCLEVLKTGMQNVLARDEMRKQGIDLAGETYARQTGVLARIGRIGDLNKSWDVLKTAELIRASFPEEASILDIGAFCSEIICILHELGYKNLHGIDLNDKLQLMPHAGEINYVNGNFLNAPFDDGFFDAITAISVIEHGFDCSKILTEMSRLLKPGGLFILSMDYWDKKIDTRGIKAFGMDWCVFSKEEVKSLIDEAQKCGFEPVGKLDFDTAERPISWNGKQYTFAWCALRKVREARACSPVNDKSATNAVDREKMAFLSTYSQKCGIATHAAFLREAIIPLLHKQKEFDSEPLVLAEETNEVLSKDDPYVFRCWRRQRETFDRALEVILQRGVSILHIEFHVGLFGQTDIVNFVRRCRHAGLRVYNTFHSCEMLLPMCADLINSSNMSFVHLEQGRIRFIAAGADPALIRVAPHGIVEKAASAMSADKAKERLNIPAGSRIISSFGFFESHKGVAEIIEALADVLKRHNAMFVYLGGPHPSNPGSLSYIEYCRSLAKRLGVSEQVVFVTKFLSEEEIGLFLSASEVIVMNYRLNRNEASGAVSVALAHSRPVITSAAPPFSLLADCTFQVSDFIGIAQAVELLFANPRFGQYLVHRANQYRKENSFGKLAQILIRVYEKIPAANPAVPGIIGQTDTLGVQKTAPLLSLEKTKPLPSRPTGNLPVVWRSPLLDTSGYAEEARQFVLGLDSIGVAIGIEPLKWSDNRCPLEPEALARLNYLHSRSADMLRKPHISVSHLFPPDFRRSSNAVYHIGRTMFETDRIPAQWVAACNGMDEIWVPSDFNITTFAASGVLREKLVKMPGGIDVDLFRTDAPAIAIEGRREFNFLSIFDWHLRKGWDVLLRAFVEEFAPQQAVSLILKVWSSMGLSLDQIKSEAAAYLQQMGLGRSLPPNIIFHEARIPSFEVPGLYSAADAFVLPTRGEGWGRPFMEAMLMGLPVIGTRWSGQLEFMNDSNSFLIDCRVSGVSEPAWREVNAFKGHSWAEPSLAHLRRLMRTVVNNPLAARGKAEVARAHIASNFSREHLALRVKDRLETVEKQLERRNGTAVLGGAAKEANVADPQAPSIIWEGSQFVHHSLALINRELCLQLLSAGYDISIVPYEPHEFGADADPRFQKLESCFLKKTSRYCVVHVRHQWPPNFTAPSSGHWVIIQPWEFGRIPREWVEPLSTLVDEIWVPSSHVLKSYVSSGVPMDRIRVIPNGVNTALFHPDAPPCPLPTQKKFKFLFVGGTIWRKGFDLLLEAYRTTFGRDDDVTLIIKDMGTDSFYQGQGAQQTIRQIQKDPRAPEILYSSHKLEEAEMPTLFAAADCLVHPYRGEGFGMPVLEAMACAIPVITTEGGATDDFCSPAQTFLIPSNRREFNHRDLELAGGAGWVLEPDLNALKALMREAVDKAAEAKQRARMVSEHIRGRYDWASIGGMVAERIRKLVGQPIRRHSRGN